MSEAAVEGRESGGASHPLGSGVGDVLTSTPHKQRTLIVRELVLPGRHFAEHAAQLSNASRSRDMIFPNYPLRVRGEPREGSRASGAATIGSVTLACL